MQNAYINFYRNFYLKTGGYIPSKPLNQTLYPGDFFQIRNGDILVLGNVFRKGIIDPQECRMEYGIKLNPASWNFSDGLKKPYSGRGAGHGTIEGHFEFSKQILSFANRGSFFFKGNDPEALLIKNWNEIQQQLIIKLTQTYYSFRELYLVTECATTADWTLAISSEEKAELEIATDSENFGLVDLFGHHSCKTIQSKDIEFYHREPNKKPVFFKAQKLTVHDEKISTFVSDLIRQFEGREQWAHDFFENELVHDSFYPTHIREGAKTSVLDMLQANQLNPNTALAYFKWTEANLDDIEKLFLTYGNQ